MSHRFLTRVLAAIGLSAVAASAAPASANTGALWTARLSRFKGDLDCSYGDDRCNRCAYNVEQQFRDLTQTANFGRRVKEWEWERSASYSPGQDPEDVLGIFPGAGHFQSFVRAQTNSGVPDLFATWSGNDATLFAARGGPDRHGRITDGPLRYTFDAPTTHPGGMQVVGKHLLIANYEGDNAWVHNYDIEDMPDEGPMTPLPSITESANISAARLAGGGYLVMAGVNSKHNDYRLFYSPSIERLTLEKAWASSVRADWDSGIDRMRGYENMSLVTECNTGKIFAVGATAGDLLTGNLYWGGESLWSLFEVTAGAPPSLRHIANNTNNMLSSECDPRASGTAFVGEGGQLGLYCHQKQSSDEVRRDGIGCAVSLLFPPALGFCAALAVKDRRIEYTEYWPTRSTPEQAAPGSGTIEVTVTVGPGSPRGRGGVVEANTGQLCELAPGESTRTCEFTVDDGFDAVLVGYFNNEIVASTYWSSPCQQANGQATLGRAFAGECTLAGGRNYQVTYGMTQLL